MHDDGFPDTWVIGLRRLELEVPAVLDAPVEALKPLQGVKTGGEGSEHERSKKPWAGDVQARRRSGTARRLQSSTPNTPSACKSPAGHNVPHVHVGALERNSSHLTVFNVFLFSQPFLQSLIPSKAETSAQQRKKERRGRTPRDRGRERERGEEAR